MSAAEGSSKGEKSGLQTALSSTLYWIGALAGAASFFVLIQEGYEFGVAKPLQDIVATYSGVVHAVGEMVKPLLVGLLAVLSSILDWNYHLVPAWKHHLLAYSALATANWRAGSASGRSAIGRSCAMCIFAMGLVVSIASEGSARLSSAASTPLTAVVIALIMMITGAALLGLSYNFPKGNMQSRAMAWILLSLPLGVIFFLLTNAGLQAVS